MKRRHKQSPYSQNPPSFSDSLKEAPPCPPKSHIWSFIMWRHRYDQDFTWQYVGLFLLGLTVQIYGIFVFIQSMIMLQSWQKTQAVILDASYHIVKRHTKTTTYDQYRPQVIYRYEVNGQTYQATGLHLNPLKDYQYTKADVQEVLDALQPHSTHFVYYDPQNPSHAFLYRDISYYSGFNLFFAGLAFSLPGSLLIFAI